MSPSLIPARRALVLEDVSLLLPAGAVVAVVGENGAGKTTLVKLLAKLYEPTSGAILSTTCRWRGFLQPSGERVWPARSRTFSVSNSVRGRPLVSATLPRLDDEPAVVAAVDRAGAAEFWRGYRSDSTLSWARPGRTASSCPLASGRSWRWRVDSCAISRCC